MNGGRIYLAVIGDIKKSRDLKNRNEIQKRIKETLNDINMKYTEDIASKFLITLGDEFQGLLRTGKNVLKIVTEIKMRLYPVKLRFGLGIGKITTDINYEMALGADGPGYYCAREAIDILKEKEHGKRVVPADICIKMEVCKEDRELLINTVFELLKTVEDGWTVRQREIIWDMLKNQDGQQRTADRLGITQSTVQKMLAAGTYYTYERALENVEKVLEEEVR